MQCRNHKYDIHEEGRNGVEATQETEHALGLVLLHESESESSEERIFKNESKIWNQRKVVRR